jgi:hypothetical protein
MSDTSTPAPEDLAELDRAYAFIMGRVVASGQAPHFTELAAELGVPMEDGKRLIRAVLNAGVPGWLHPGTDYIASFPPFNLQPTHYRVSVDGIQRWFAQ